MSNIAGNRHSTPEAANSLRPPNQRAAASAGGHLLRASADMSGASVPSPLSGRNIRPSSEVYVGQQGQAGPNEDSADSSAQKWISEVSEFENTLDEMAAATVDQDFKDELSAIEQWFKVLTEAERTSALYALLQQTTHVQMRFFIQILQQMDKDHPLSGALSPANFGEKDAMSNRMSDASGKLAITGGRDSTGPGPIGRPPPSPGAKRNSGLPQDTINAMFPIAASAIASKRAEYSQQVGGQLGSNRNSAAFGAGDRSSLAVPTPNTPGDMNKDNAGNSQTVNVPWTAKNKSQDAGPSPMGQFSQPPQSAGLRAPRPAALNQQALLAGTGNELPMMSPAFNNGSWASMTNTPMVANFGQQHSQADMVANATAMKLAALSTVNNRVMLDDAKKYRRARSNDGVPPSAGLPMSPGFAGMQQQPGNVVVVSENGQLLNGTLSQQQMAQIQLQQAQQAALLAQGRSRPNSPGMAMRSPGMPQASPMFQNNGFLSAYDGSGISPGMAGLSLGQYGLSTGGSASGEEMERGRSPRGRRGSSKPPEDPTDIKLLEDISAWLRMLRLHKYTDNLKTTPWKELVNLDDAGLEAKGVNALGARRKMLKAFSEVKEAQQAGKLPS